MVKTDEHNYNDDQILKMRVSHMIKFAWSKPTSSFSKKGKQKSRLAESSRKLRTRNQ